MPDISMCTNEDCRKSSLCKRHADSGTLPNVYCQTYITFNPMTDGNCDYFWDIETRWRRVR